MTERTWILLIICVTVISLAAIVADCYKERKRIREQKREQGWRPYKRPKKLDEEAESTRTENK